MQNLLPSVEEAKTSVLKKISMAAEKWSKGNTMGYVECASDDIVWIDELGAQKPVIGIENLKAYLKGFMGQIPAHDFKLTGHLFQVFEDMVIVSYRYQAIFDGESADPWKVSSVYRYEAGDWRSVHENWTEVKKPAN